MKIVHVLLPSTSMCAAASTCLRALCVAVLAQATLVLAQPDYAPAHWVPATGCTKYYTTGNGHNFCVIHDMEGYYLSSISYLNRCDISASIHFCVNGLQNGSDSLGHRENNPSDAVAGDITQSVREQNYSWHATCWNRYMFGTEHEGFVSSPVWFTEEMYQASAALHRHLCDTYGIPKDRNHIIGHDQKRIASWVSWMQTNWPAIDPTCNTHTDPGQYWDWTHFMALINSGGPTITAQPQGLTMDPGGNPSFSVSATGTGTLGYQWRLNGTNVSAATTSSYTRTNAQLADAGSYSVVVTDTTGSTTSSNAVLTINSAPIITRQPEAQLAAVGQAATFSAGIAGTAPMSYQWLFNSLPLPGATGSMLALAAARSTNVGSYSIAISNRLGSTVSSNAALVLIQTAILGDNTFGQGDAFAGTSNLVAVAAGAWHNLGLRADGRVVAWGDNGSGQIDVPGELTNALGIAAGGYHSLAVRANGTVAAWGGNDYGQADVPAGLSAVIGIGGGNWHSVALRANGTVVAWGDNSFGQLNVPAGLTNVTAIAAGGNHTLALRANGTVVAWGENTGPEGNVTGQSVVPSGLTNVRAIGAGDYHSLAVKKDGTVMAWGDNSDGQSSVPAGLKNVVAVAGGGSHSVAMGTGGTIAAWGADWNGQCDVPSSLPPVSGVAAGAYHTLVLLADSIPLPQLLNPALKPTGFSSLAQTLSGKSYALEFKTSLKDANWAAVGTNQGNGSLVILADPAVATPQRYYRMRQW